MKNTGISEVFCLVLVIWFLEFFFCLVLVIWFLGFFFCLVLVIWFLGFLITPHSY
jgi:hypothetical protein